jgi:hypothetical protein
VRSLPSSCPVCEGYFVEASVAGSSVHSLFCEVCGAQLHVPCDALEEPKDALRAEVEQLRALLAKLVQGTPRTVLSWADEVSSCAHCTLCDAVIDLPFEAWMAPEFHAADCAWRKAREYLSPTPPSNQA